MAALSDFSKFHHLVTGEANRKNLIESNQVCRKTLSVGFRVFFDKPISPKTVWSCLPPTLTKTNDPWVLGIDGKWLRRKGVVVIYRDVTHKENLFWSYWSSESYEALFTDLEKLRRLLNDRLPNGIISDWKGAIVTAAANFLPGVPHQRCLTHVVREAKRLLPLNSPLLLTRILRRIAKQLPRIGTEEERMGWLADLIKWERIYGYRLKERTTNPETSKKWWYTHGNLRRAWRLLTDDWHPFFVHLDKPLIPSTNNSLEGVNSQIKKRLGQHRGMKTLQQVSFLFWHLAFTRTKSKPNLKKLWGEWKT